MNEWALAQLNIARLKAPLDSPLLEDFVNNLDRINQLAESSQGFVWRYMSDEPIKDTDQGCFATDLIVNLSVWESLEALHQYVFHSAHLDIMRQRKKWFDAMETPHAVMWWVPRDHTPSLQEAAEKLHLLTINGPSPDAFTAKTISEKPIATR